LSVTKTSEEAVGVIRIAIRRLATAYPFHAHLLSLASVEEEADISTMGVTVRSARVMLLYSPEFVLAHQFDEIVGVLHHEVLHVVFGHLFQAADRYPDQQALTIAQEVTVNEWVPESLPVDGIMLKDYPELPPGEDTDTRYRRLAGRGNHEKVVLIDEHGVWDEAKAAGTAAEAAAISAVRRAAEMLTPDEKSRIAPEMQTAIDTACSGRAAGRSVEQVVGGNASVDWRKVLRSFAGGRTTRQPSYLRPPRRFPHLMGIVPGSILHPGRPRVMAVIDTSGSISADVLASITGELRRMTALANVVVVQCDAEIHSIEPMGASLERVVGRGGTDLRPPFESNVLMRVRPDVVVYFTDGYGPAPDNPPRRIRVLWCLTTNGVRPAPWGRSVRMTGGSVE